MGLIGERWGQFWSSGNKGGQIGSSKVRFNQLRSEELVEMLDPNMFQLYFRQAV